MTLWLPWLLKLRVCPAAGAEKAWRATAAGGRTVASDKELSRYVSLLSHRCDQDQYKVIRLHVTETNDVIICVAWVLWASAVCVCVCETLALLHTVWPSSSCQNYWCSINIMPASGFHDVSWWFSLCPPLWLHECWTVFSVSGLQQQWICGSVSHGPGPSETVQASHLSWLK